VPAFSLFERVLYHLCSCCCTMNCFQQAVISCLILIFQEDIELMASLGFSAYRFSISWTRIFPGTLILTERTFCLLFANDSASHYILMHNIISLLCLQMV